LQFSTPVPAIPGRNYLPFCSSVHKSDRILLFDLGAVRTTNRTGYRRKPPSQTGLCLRHIPLPDPTIDRIGSRASSFREASCESTDFSVGSGPSYLFNGRPGCNVVGSPAISASTVQIASSVRLQLLVSTVCRIEMPQCRPPPEMVIPSSLSLSRRLYKNFVMAMYSSNQHSASSGLEEEPVRRNLLTAEKRKDTLQAVHHSCCISADQYVNLVFPRNRLQGISQQSCSGTLVRINA